MVELKMTKEENIYLTQLEYLFIVSWSSAGFVWQGIFSLCMESIQVIYPVYIY